MPWVMFERGGGERQLALTHAYQANAARAWLAGVWSDLEPWCLSIIALPLDVAFLREKPCPSPTQPSGPAAEIVGDPGFQKIPDRLKKSAAQP